MKTNDVHDRIMLIYLSDIMDVRNSRTYWIPPHVSDDEAMESAKRSAMYKENADVGRAIINTPRLHVKGRALDSGTDRVAAVYTAEFMNFRTAVTFWLRPCSGSQMGKEVKQSATYRAIKDPAYFIIDTPDSILMEGEKDQ